jgi:inosine/xanthosine triphosphatase
MVVICVGSLNPTKLEGVRRAFNAFFSSAEVRGCIVETGLPLQPIGLEVTMLGARVRGEKALQRYNDCEFGVGVEAGFIPIGKDYYDVQVAYITTKDGSSAYGFSSAFPLPKKFVEQILSGTYKELEEVVDSYYRTKKIGEKGGFIKLLTKGVITREDLTYTAVVMALIPFINRELYH